MLSAILALAPLFDDPQIREATASASQEGNPLQHLWDGDLDTRWAAEGRPWIEISFDRLLEISAFEIAPYLSEEREYRFVLQVPAGEGWRPAGTLHSVRAAHGLQLVPLPEPISTARLRIACQGNNANDWNTYYELRFPGVQPPAPPPAPTVPRPSNLPTRMGLVAEVFAENPMLASPVAVHVDPSGAVFVTETQRRKKQNLDIRNNADWIDVELALGSVAEKEAFLRANLTPERSEENRRRVDDYNKDGSHDWRDLMAVPDRVHRLVDVDGDGGADEATVYADDLAGVVSGVAAGVFAHRGEVFVTQCPDVYRYRDTDGDGRADERDAIASGFGVHIAYGGHNMHGLIVGPDGRLYWSIGDIASDHHPWEGAVFRCWPDGSEFEVFARGLRNPQELAFDEYGDLFTGDNDGDFGDRERWVHVLAGADYGWRMNFQLQTQSWGAPTGNYSVWIEDGLWRPPFEGRAAYAQPPVANIQDGPCGLTYYPGIGLDESFDGTFFLAHFRGGTNSSVRRLRNGGCDPPARRGRGGRRRHRGDRARLRIGRRALPLRLDQRLGREAGGQAAPGLRSHARAAPGADRDPAAPGARLERGPARSARRPARCAELRRAPRGATRARRPGARDREAIGLRPEGPGRAGRAARALGTRPAGAGGRQPVRPRGVGHARSARGDARPGSARRGRARVRACSAYPRGPCERGRAPAAAVPAAHRALTAGRARGRADCAGHPQRRGQRPRAAPRLHAGPARVRRSTSPGSAAHPPVAGRAVGCGGRPASSC
ncbi:MAG: discoidin domain-containing protein [Planctomycetota bacterium]|nr:discoidin domain-containing protein [Planctomycetota bacterium]